MPARLSIATIIVAAGRGLRAGGGIPKQWRRIAGRSVAEHTLDAFRDIEEVGRVIVVVHPDDRDRLAGRPGLEIVTGGASRSDSVRAGLEALAVDAPDLVLIHDVARPLVSAALVRRVIAALGRTPAAAPALGVVDALWYGADGQVTGMRDRAGLYRAQTPQGFRFAEILAAHRAHGAKADDDVSVARAAGLDVSIVEGDETNLKITTPADFARAGMLLEGRMDIRFGNGFDVHAFAPGDRVTLCGVEVPHDRTLSGHSDADVGMHALTDAIYGALAEGDIGRHFPPSDPQWKGAASRIFLAHAAERIGTRGFRLTNADVTLICEAPKIGPHAGEMAACLARILGTDPERVSVKATTSERLGFTGRGEGIAAIATVALVAS